MRSRARTRPVRPVTRSTPKLGPAGRFLYAQVAEEIRRRVTRGLYPPGDRIPSEADLVREFNVSAITIRRTIRDLQLEGLLVGRQGLGVFVTDKRRIRRSLGGHPTTPIRDEMRRAGVEPGVKVFSLSLGPGEEPMLRRLGLEPGTLLYRLDLLILADNEPVGLETTYLRREIGDNLRTELSQEFIYPLLVSHGVAVDHMDLNIEGGTVGQEEAGPLGLPVGFPLLVVHYTALSPEGVPIFAGRTATRADRFVYEFCPRPGMHSTPNPEAS